MQRKVLRSDSLLGNKVTLKRSALPLIWPENLVKACPCLLLILYYKILRSSNTFGILASNSNDYPLFGYIFHIINQVEANKIMKNIRSVRTLALVKKMTYTVS